MELSLKAPRGRRGVYPKLNTLTTQLRYGMRWYSCETPTKEPMELSVIWNYQWLAIFTIEGLTGEEEGGRS